MNYPTIPHTRAVSYSFLDHVLGLFEDQTKNIKAALEEEVLVTLIDFMGTPIEDLITMEWTDEEFKIHFLTKPSIRLLKNIHAWVLWGENN